MFDLIAFDADDTLWHNERLYEQTQTELADLLTDYADSETVIQRLYDTEMANLECYGYGIKSFTLSMIETAVELGDGKITGSQIRQIINFSKEMLTTEVELLDHVAETVGALARSYRLMVLTKGDLRDQQWKLSHSGIGDSFEYIEIVSEKNEQTYAALLQKHQIAPSRFLMVGNSLRSDILPVVALGGHAVHIPYHITWQHVMGSVFTGELRPGAAGLDRVKMSWQLLLAQVGWAGVTLALVGMLMLWRRRAIDLLILTGLGFLAFVAFNLVYFVGDINVFFIPVWLIVSLWLGVGIVDLADPAARYFVRRKTTNNPSPVFLELRQKLEARGYQWTVHTLVDFQPIGTLRSP